MLVSATKAIFWDNDGVLVNTEHIYFEATQRILATIGIPLTPNQYLEMFLVQGKGAWHLAEERDSPPAKSRHSGVNATRSMANYWRKRPSSSTGWIESWSPSVAVT